MEPDKQLFKEYKELYKNCNMCTISCIRSLKCSPYKERYHEP